MTNEERKYDVIFMAESVKSQYLYDLAYKIDVASFFRSQFEIDKAENEKVVNSIYKKIT